MWLRMYSTKPKRVGSVRQWLSGDRWLVGMALALFFFLACPPAAGAGAFHQGVKAAQQQDYATAVQHFTEAIQQQESLALAYSHRCLMHLLIEQPANAAADCTQALQIRPDLPTAHFYRGLAQYRLGQYTAAIADLTQHLQHQPQDGRAYYNRGLAEFAMSQYEVAIADYQTALAQAQAMPPEDQAEIYNDLGLAYLANAQPHRAMTSLDQAIALDQTSPRAYFNRGCLCHRLGNYLAALANFEQVLALDPAHAETYLNRGVVQQQLGHRTAAIADLEMAIAYFQQQGNFAGAHKAKLHLQQLSRRATVMG